MRLRLHLLASISTLVASAVCADPQLNCVDFRVGSAIRVYAQRVAPDGSTSATWTPDPARLCVAPGHEVSFAAVPAGDSAVVVAWTEPHRDGSEIRAQRLEAGVGVTVTWPSTGVAIASAALDQNGPRAADDGAGGAFVAWQDFRGGRPQTFAQHVGADGTTTAGWPSGGLALGNSSTDQVAPMVIGDGAGGALVAWQEFENGLFKIRLLRLTPAGAVAAPWPSAGVIPASSTRHQLSPVLASDDAGGAIVVWEESILGERKLRAARVDGNGLPTGGWPAGGLALSASVGQQRAAAVIRDGAGGALVVWEDTRSGAGDVYVQRITGAGAIALGWSATGLAACAQPAEQSAPTILADGAGGAYVAWEDFRASSADVYAQRVTAAGALSGGWPATGVAMTTDAGEQYAPRLMPDGTGGAIATWFDTRRFTDSPVDVPSTPKAGVVFALYGLRPSPAVGPVRVSFALPDGRTARLELLDIAGRRILEREVGSLGAGRHVVELRGRRELAAGIYLVRLTHAGRSLTATAVVLR